MCHSNQCECLCTFNFAAGKFLHCHLRTLNKRQLSVRAKQLFCHYEPTRVPNTVFKLQHSKSDAYCTLQFILLYISISLINTIVHCNILNQCCLLTVQSQIDAMRNPFIMQLLVASLVVMIPGKDRFDLRQLHSIQILRE